MKKSQRDTFYATEEFEDLTLFADESFDTQDVDLFEFTSEETSPLTRLKSIILSLDWEINDEILQELADEIQELQSTWQNDKVAAVYLQGLNKIGGYLRSKGAYAHPNSIKLLLTFFYDFEKITSTQEISEDEINRLLKGDIRKFKILQYQINQSEKESSPVPDVLAVENVVADMQQSHSEESNPAKELKAAVLSLDWEVTDESLQQFNKKLSLFYEKFADNKPALVLVQGLQALGDYIAEERAEAHPEAFTLLHFFNESLGQITATGEQALDQKTIQDILVDRINRLNNLKMLIANPSRTLADETVIDEMVDEISAPVPLDVEADQITQTVEETPAAAASLLSEDFAIELETDEEADLLSTGTLEAEIDSLFSMDAKPAMETSDVQYPDEILPPDAIHPVDDELADDFIESNLSSKRGLMPALSDADELTGFNEDAEPLDLPAQSDLAEQLDFLFAETDDKTIGLPGEPPAVPLMEPERIPGDTNEPVEALADVDFDFTEEVVTEALSGVDQPAEPAEREKDQSQTDESVLDIQSKLDSFFAEAVEGGAETELSAQHTPDDAERSLFIDEENDIQAALADSEEDRGFSEDELVGSLDTAPMGEIEEKLDFFFGTDEEDESSAPEFSFESSMTKAPEDQFTDLADAVEEGTGNKKPVLDNALERDLNFFFNASEDDEESPAVTTDDELTQALEATFDEDQGVAAKFGQERTPTMLSLEERRQIHLAALGARLPGLVRAPSLEGAAESATLLGKLKTEQLSTEQQSLVQLLDSVIILLVRMPNKDDAATEKLVNYLYECLFAGQSNSEMVTEAVSRYTNWLQQACSVMPLVPTPTSHVQEPQFAYTAKELYFELSELRAHIKKEFAALRHEMHHKH
jgi:pilus assembly protein FimV